MTAAWSRSTSSARATSSVHEPWAGSGRGPTACWPIGPRALSSARCARRTGGRARHGLRRTGRPAQATWAASPARVAGRDAGRGAVRRHVVEQRSILGTHGLPGHAPAALVGARRVGLPALGVEQQRRQALGEGLGRRGRHQDAPAARQHLARVQVGRRHDREARAQRVRQGARHDLVEVRIRGDEHVGGLQPAGQLRLADEAVLEPDPVGDPRSSARRRSESR